MKISFTPSQSKIESEIKELFKTSEKKCWQLDREASSSNKQERVNDIILRIWPSSKKSWIDRVGERYDQFNQGLDRIHDDFFNGWNRKCEQLGVSKIKIKYEQWFSIDQERLNQEEKISDILDRIRPWWDFMGLVAKARIKKVERVLDNHFAKMKIQQYSLINKKIGNLLEAGMTPSEIIEDLRKKKTDSWNPLIASLMNLAAKAVDEVKTGANSLVQQVTSSGIDEPSDSSKSKQEETNLDVRYFSDEDLYLLIHQKSHEESSPLLLSLETSNPIKAWEKWKKHTLEELFKSKGAPFALYFDLTKPTSKNLNALNKTFQLHRLTDKIILKGIMIPSRLTPITESPEKKNAVSQLTSISSLIPILDLTMHLESSELWNCFPYEIKEFFICVVNSPIYKNYVNIHLENQIRREYDNHLEELRNQYGRISSEKEYYREYTQNILKDIIKKNLGVESYQIEELLDQPNNHLLRFQVFFKNKEEKQILFIISLDILKATGAIKGETNVPYFNFITEINIHRKSSRDLHLEAPKTPRVTTRDQLFSFIQTIGTNQSQIERDQALEDIFSDLNLNDKEEKEREKKEDIKNSYKESLELFKILVKSKQNTFSKDNPLPSLNVELLEAAIRNFNLHNISVMRIYAQKIYLLARNRNPNSPNKTLGVTQIENLNSPNKTSGATQIENESKGVTELLDFLYEMKKYVEESNAFDLETKARLKSIQKELEEITEEIRLASPKKDQTLKSIQALRAELQIIESKLNKLDLAILAIVDPSVVKKINVLKTDLKNIHNYIKNSLLDVFINEIEVIQREVSENVEAVKKFQLKDIAKNNSKELLTAFRSAKASLDSYNSKFSTIPDELMSDPRFNLFRKDLQRRESELMSYELTLNKIFINEVLVIREEVSKKVEEMMKFRPTNISANNYKEHLTAFQSAESSFNLYKSTFSTISSEFMSDLGHEEVLNDFQQDLDEKKDRLDYHRIILNPGNPRTSGLTF